MKTLRKFAAGLSCAWNGVGELDIPIAKIQSDSRKVQKGDLFVAVPGPHVDGHRFIKEAVQRGAGAVVSERGDRSASESGVPLLLVSSSRAALAYLAASSFGFPARKLKLIAVTGTNGKTTTACLIQHLLSRTGPAGLIGTIHYDDGKTREPASNTTPGPERLQELFARMVARGVATCVMEVSSHALDQGRTQGLEFSSAVFTNLTQDHLDYHHDLETYFQAKRKLFCRETPPRHSIVCGDDPYGIRLAGELLGKRCRTYGFGAACDDRARDFEGNLNGISFTLVRERERHPVRAPLVFRHNALNIMAAVSAMTEEGYSLRDTVQRLSDFPGVPGRMEPVQCGQEFHVFIDYAHTPDAIRQVLSYARTVSSGRLITVFGCGGDRDSAKRPLMGRIADQFSDLVILTSDNPRSENPADIIYQIQQAIDPKARHSELVTCEDRSGAIRLAIEAAKPGDSVFIFGKGHEDCQIVGTQRIPFRDQDVAKEWIQKTCLRWNKPHALSQER